MLRNLLVQAPLFKETIRWLPLCQQVRNTYILKRKYPPPLSKKNHRKRNLKARDYLYELVEHTSNKKKPSIQLILTQDVEGIGGKGDVVEVRPRRAREELLPFKKAIYATQENLAELEKSKENASTERKQSSHWAPRTIKDLSVYRLGIVMNLEESWTLEPWHIRVSFRKAGIAVPEEAITMPTHPISGPDINIEDKEFLIKVKINDFEETRVRCRIHHWSTKLENRLPPVPEHWKLPSEPLFPEEAELLSKLPKLKLVD